MQINLDDWLMAEVGTGTDSQTGVPGGVPASQPSMGQLPAQDPNVTQAVPQMGQPAQPMPDVASDPHVPDMPEDEAEQMDFPTWRKKFIVDSASTDVADLKDQILQVRDRDLDPYQRKFVEDNLQILMARELTNIDKACKEVRKLLKEEIDHNNPATTVVTHLTSVLNLDPKINHFFIQLAGMRGVKGEVHRQFIAALLGAIQVGTGGYNEDLILEQKDYSIRLSTRMNSRFGEVHLGTWSLKQDDPERYLKAPELKRLEDGSPEERDVLRRRIVMESISKEFETRAFLVTVVGADGTIYTLGWDLATSLRSAYTEGKLVVRAKSDDNAEAMIDDDGAIIPFVDLKVMYVQPTGEVDDAGKPEKREVEFLTRRYGQLFLTASLPVIKEASASFQGIVLKEMPWPGSPTDLRTLSRCCVSLPEQISRSC